MQPIGSIAIVGGGTAGWIAASMLARALPGTGCRITVIESPEIGTVGVGEATIPPIIDLLRFLSINEADFVRHTQATYKLGIRFHDWHRPGSQYWHPFGTFGAPLNRRPFFHTWQRAVDEGRPMHFHDYSLCAALAEAGRFRYPDPAAQNAAAGLRYALHFDAGLVARYLRAYAERLGVVCLQRTVVEASLRAEGTIGELLLNDGSKLVADLYLDCSGFRGLLIEKALRAGYVDWSDYLPCDRAVAVGSAPAPGLPPMTQATALAGGWRWRIPLQQRTGNGYVYSSAHVSDQRALDELLAQIGGPPLAEPRYLRFIAGRRRAFWIGNCVALGLASGFLEPLESTSIHLVVSAVYRLLEYFPDRTLPASLARSYNRELIEEMETIRDFVILHYCLTDRRDSEFWNHCRTMQLPDSLRSRIELYRETGRIRTGTRDLFSDLSWFYIFEGLGVRPLRHDPLIDVIPQRQLQEMLESLAADVRALAAGAPTHASYFAAEAAPAAGTA